MTSVFSGYRASASRNAAAKITLTSMTIEDTAASGSAIGTLSAPGAGWTFRLADDAGGLVAISGSQLVVGATRPTLLGGTSQTILVAATDGVRATAALIVLTVRRALPALPLAAGAKIMGFGHSMIARGGWGTLTSGAVTNVSQSNARGVLPWVRLLDDRFNIDVFADAQNRWALAATDYAINGAFQGVAGDHLIATNGLPGTLARTPYVVARQPAIVYLHIGENDVNSSVSSSAELIARLDSQLRLLRNQGLWTVLQTLVHRGRDGTGWPTGDPRFTIVDEVNVWIKAQSSREGVKICDTTALGVNWPGFDASLFNVDTIHFAPTGARAVADALLPILRGMVAAGNVSSYEAATGNLWTNPQLSGTAGTKTANTGSVAPTGTVATGHVVRMQTGASTAVCSIEAIDATFNKQVVTVTPVNDALASPVHELRIATPAVQLLSGINVAVGDWLEAYLYAELSAWDYWMGLVWQMETYNAGASVLGVQSGMINPDSATRRLFKPGNAGFAGWIKLCRFQVPSAADRIRLDSRPIQLTFDKTGTGTGTAKFSKPILRKAVEPKTAWSLA